MTPSIHTGSPRRAAARTKVVGIVQIELGAKIGGYRIGDLSFGGIRVVGRPSQIAAVVGDRVRVIVSGRRYGQAFDLDTTAEVRRVGSHDLGLAWDVANPLVAEQVAYWVESAAAAYDEYIVS